MGAARARRAARGGRLLIERRSARFLAGLAVCAVAAFLVRAWPPWNRVFTEDHVRFQETDPWYHVRRIESLTRHFPHLDTYDPYLIFPGGQTVTIPPLFDWSIGAVAWAVGGGTPSTRTVETVAALAPPLLAAVLVFVTGLLARRWFDPAAGLASAALLAILPGPLLERGVLGRTDHHVAEALLTTLTLLALTRAVQGGGTRSALLAGLALGAYFLTWSGAPLFASALCAWLLADLALGVDAEARRRAAAAVATAAATGLGLVAGLQPESLPLRNLQLFALALTLAFALGVRLLPRVLTRSVVVGAAAGVVVVAGAAWLTAPRMVSIARSQLERFFPAHGARTVSEVAPLLDMGGRISVWPAWLTYGPALPLALVGLILVARPSACRRRPGRSLLLAWMLVSLVATLGQSRFGYYLSVCVAVVNGFLCAESIRLVGPGAPVPAGPRRRDALIYRVLAVLLIVWVLVLPSAARTAQAVETDLGPSVETLAALDWMRRFTPEPFGKAGYFDARHAAPPPGKDPPAAAYGVLAWWDYGYEVIRVAQRVPTAIPSQHGAGQAARLFLATDEAALREAFEASGIRYVFADENLVFLPDEQTDTFQGRFGALAAWAGLPRTGFVRFALAPGETGTPPLFRAAYFRTLAVRLVIGSGRAMLPAGPVWVVPTGSPVGRSRIPRAFPSYEAARRFADESGGGYDLASDDPLRTCVPVPALDGLRLVYEAPARPGGIVRAPKVFEWVASP